MNNLSRGTWLALAVVVAVPATVAIAKTDRTGWQMTPETRSRLEDGRLAMVKAALQLNADQEKLWAPVELQVRDTFKAREEKRAERIKRREERKAEKDGGEQKRADLAERFTKMSQRMSERADRGRRSRPHSVRSTRPFPMNRRTCCVLCCISFHPALEWATAAIVGLRAAGVQAVRDITTGAAATTMVKARRVCRTKVRTTKALPPLRPSPTRRAEANRITSRFSPTGRARMPGLFLRAL